MVYVTDGTIAAGDERLVKSDACSDAGAPLPPLHASRDTLVAFLADLAATASRSGHDQRGWTRFADLVIALPTAHSPRKDR